ncbi:hypothetical protein BV509_20470 [Rhodovulum sulfidophilum]|nr:hypothetical protein BV509_20470 [Rhodovulum sulfidophilum]
MTAPQDATVTLTGPNGVTTGPIPLDTFTAGARLPMKETAEDEAVRDRTYRVAADELRGFIERFEALAEEKAQIGERIANPCTGVRFSYSPPTISMG